jgi:hypothetical protein
MICPTGKAENFSKWDWTDKIRLKRFNKFDFWRKRGSENFIALYVSALPSTAPSSGLLVEARARDGSERRRTPKFTLFDCPFESGNP